jgi:hypothetical protein
VTGLPPADAPEDEPLDDEDVGTDDETAVTVDTAPEAVVVTVFTGVGAETVGVGAGAGGGDGGLTGTVAVTVGTGTGAVTVGTGTGAVTVGTVGSDGVGSPSASAPPAPPPPPSRPRAVTTAADLTHV